MNQDLTSFSAQWLRVAIMTLVPVILTTFISIPMNLGGHRGDTMAAVVTSDGHMT